MVSQYKTVSIFILFIFLFFYSASVQSQQLALPKKDLAIDSKYKITVNKLVARYSDYLFSSGIKDNVITRSSILYNMIDGYTLLDNVTLSIINNQSHLARELKRRKVFYFHLTNFII